MAVSSPCIGVCMVDPAHDWCAGCFRTRDEIAHWTRMGEREKAELVDLCAQRQTRQTRQTETGPRYEPA